MKKKTVALLLACVMLFGAAMGGTLAWLTAKTDPVENIFTVGDINISLSETGATDNKKNFDFVPGDTLAKDPKVTVTAGSEACYLFVKVVDANNTRTDLPADDNKIINWSVREGWTEGTGTDTANGQNGVPAGYWFRTVDAETAKAGVSYYVLTGDVVAQGKDQKYPNGCITVNENVTKAMVDEKDTGIEAKKPTITVTAAAVQYANIADVAAAFGKLSGF